MKRPQWITVGIGVALVATIYLFGRTVPAKKNIAIQQSSQAENTDVGVSIDSIILSAKKQLPQQQALRLNMLENSISRGDVKDQMLKIYHQLAHFWADTGNVFEPYAWYEAEAARLENSEKSLTFAAQLFLDNLQGDEVPERRKWKALQAKDLFERSLKLNPANDSSQIGLGACYLFGGISAMPMEGILKVKAVADRDSTNVYAQMTLAKGSVISGQYDKAISRLETVNRIEPDNVEALLLMADVYETTGDKKTAIGWYQKSLEHISRQDMRSEIEKRINDLKK